MAQSGEMQSKQMSMKKAQDQESTLTPNLICCTCHFTDILRTDEKPRPLKNHMEESVLVRIVFPSHGFEQTPLHGYSTAATLIYWHFLKNVSVPTLVSQGWSKCCSKAVLTALPQSQKKGEKIRKKTQSQKKHTSRVHFLLLKSATILKTFQLILSESKHMNKLI